MMEGTEPAAHPPGAEMPPVPSSQGGASSRKQLSEAEAFAALCQGC